MNLPLEAMTLALGTMQEVCSPMIMNQFKGELWSDHANYIAEDCASHFSVAGGVWSTLHLIKLYPKAASIMYLHNGVNGLQ